MRDTSDSATPPHFERLLWNMELLLPSVRQSSGTIYQNSPLLQTPLFSGIPYLLCDFFGEVPLQVLCAPAT
jgi:hypothetical protein